MPLSHRFGLLLIVWLLFGLAVFLAAPAQALTLDEVTAAVMNPGWSWLVVPAIILALLALAWLCRQAAVYAKERLHASRVARLLETVGSVANGIATTLLAHPPTTAAALLIVRQAAVAQGIAYMKTNLADTIAKIGISDDTLAARLDNEVAGKLLAAPVTGASLTDDAKAAAQAALLSVAGTMAVPSTEAAASAA